MIDVLALVRERIEGERSRVSRLPAPGIARLPERSWQERTRAARLSQVFDTDGHPSPPSDDERYDEVYAQMIAEGGVEEARRFEAMRPPRSNEPPPTWNGRRPNPLSCGPSSRAFEIRVERDGREMVLASLRARTSYDAYTSLASTSLGTRASADHHRLDASVFDALVAACDVVFGEDAPRFEPPELQQRWEVHPRGGEPCARCGEAIERYGLVHMIGWQSPSMQVVGLDLFCAHHVVPDALAEAARDTKIGDPEVRRLARGSVVRCSACRGIIRSGDWRLESVLAADALHFDCALKSQRESFRRALAETPELDAASEWRAKLSEASE